MKPERNRRDLRARYMIDRDMLERMKEEIERLPDWHEVNSPAWILYHQIEVILSGDYSCFEMERYFQDGAA